MMLLGIRKHFSVFHTAANFWVTRHAHPQLKLCLHILCFFQWFHCLKCPPSIMQKCCPVCLSVRKEVAMGLKEKNMWVKLASFRHELYWWPTPLEDSCLENPMDGGAWWAAVHGVTRSRTRLSDFPFTFHFHALEKEMAAHSSVLAWRIPGMGELGGLPSMGSHRIGHDWSNLAATVAAVKTWHSVEFYFGSF